MEKRRAGEWRREGLRSGEEKGWGVEKRRAGEWRREGLRSGEEKGWGMKRIYLE